MTLAEILKANGVADEVNAKILADMKANSIYTSAEENLDIRYGKLKTNFDNLTAQHNEAQTLIEQLKAGNKGNEQLQTKVTEYEGQIAQLQEQLKVNQIESEVKVALLGAKVTDIDYMTFKLKEKGELELDENGKIKGIEDKIAGLKTQFPAQFEKGKEGGFEIDPKPLPKGDPSTGMTKSDFLKKPYNERLAYKTENPSGYNEIMKG